MVSRTMRSFALASCAVTIAAATLACDDSGNQAKLTAGLVSSPSAAFAVRMTPVIVPLIALSRASCPQTQPFTTNMDLVLGASANDFFFNRLTLRFVDGSGVASVQFFTTNDLFLMFGNTVVHPGVPRTFTMHPQFGCGLSRPRTIDATIVLLDGTGLVHEATATATLQ
jgi:hypothetical protein